MRELAIRWIAVGKAGQDRDLSLWVKAGFEGTSVIGTKRTCRGSMPMSDLPIPIRSLADAVLATNARASRQRRPRQPYAVSLSERCRRREKPRLLRHTRARPGLMGLDISFADDVF